MIINSLKPLNSFGKSTILDACQDSESSTAKDPIFPKSVIKNKGSFVADFPPKKNEKGFRGLYSLFVIVNKFVILKNY